METKHVYRWYWVWDFDKEEDWLNEMALEGWVLDGVGFCSYTFRRCEPGEYEVRMILAENCDDYISFVESMGAEYIGRVFRWVYFRKKCADGPFELLSDIDSRVAHLKRIERLLIAVGLLNLVMGLNISSPFSRINLLCVALLGYGVGRLQGMRRMLEKERELHE